MVQLSKLNVFDTSTHRDVCNFFLIICCGYASSVYVVAQPFDEKSIILNNVGMAGP